MSTLYTNRLFLNGNKVKQMYINGSKVYQLVEGTAPEPPTPTPYEEQNLTFEILSAGTIVWKRVGGSDSRTIKYSTDDGLTWNSITSSTGGTSIEVNAGDIVQFAGDNISYYYSNASNRFAGTAKFNVYGNIMSLINSSSFAELSSFTAFNRYAFSQLFYGNTGIISAENLILPVKTLEYYVYRQMFYGCTNLIKGPQILAETFAIESCLSMFESCSNLNYIKCLATDITANNCTTNWVNNVSSTGTFVKAASMSGWARGAAGIPNHWTVQDAS